MMSLSDRRLTPRFNLKIPLVLSREYTRRARPRGQIHQYLKSRGYFKTAHPVFVGLPVQVLLQMPSQCGGYLATRVVYTGRVSHIATKRRGHPGLGVGVEFFYSERLES